MAEMWKPQDKKVLQHWIDSIITEAEEKLSDWERNFITSCQDGLDRYGKLTEKMENKLESIYARLTS